MRKTREQILADAQRRAGPAATRFVEWAGGELWRRAYKLGHDLGFRPDECEEIARVTVQSAVKGASSAVVQLRRDRAFRGES